MALSLHAQVFRVPSTPTGGGAFTFVNASQGTGADTSAAPITTTGAKLLWMVDLEFGISACTTTIVDNVNGSVVVNTWLTGTDRVSGNIHTCLHYSLSPANVGVSHYITVVGGSFTTIPDFEAWSDSGSGPTFDQQNGGTVSGSTTISTGSITPTANNCLVVTGVGTDSHFSQAWTIDSSFVITNNNQNGGNEQGAGGRIVQTTAGAVNPTWTYPSSANQSAFIASFKP